MAPQPSSHHHPCLPSLVMSGAEESSRAVSLRVSPLLRSSRVSLASPGPTSFRLKLEVGKACGWPGPSNPQGKGEGRKWPRIYLFMSGRPQELPLPTLWLRLVEDTRPGLQ